MALFYSPRNRRVCYVDKDLYNVIFAQVLVNMSSLEKDQSDGTANGWMDERTNHRIGNIADREKANSQRQKARQV